jgi:polyphosphate kinase
MFSKMEIVEIGKFRVTRNADLELDDELVASERIIARQCNISLRRDAFDA